MRSDDRATASSRRSRAQRFPSPFIDGFPLLRIAVLRDFFLELFPDMTGDDFGVIDAPGALTSQVARLADCRSKITGIQSDRFNFKIELLALVVKT